MKTKALVLLIASASSLGAAGYGLYQTGMSDGQQLARSAGVTGTDQSPTDAVSDRKVLYWHDPMVPGHRFDKPGKSPFMDMQLVPVYADAESDANSVRVSPRIQQNLGMRTAQATLGVLPQPIEAAGNLASGQESVLVPIEALIRTGTRNIVIVSEGNGLFHPQEVRIGRELNDKIEILAGVSAGDRVVTSGQFLIDSEASMKGVLSRSSAGDKP